MRKYGLVLTLSVMFMVSLTMEFYIFHAMTPTPKGRILVAVEHVTRIAIDADGHEISTKHFVRKIFKHVPISEGAQ